MTLKPEPLDPAVYQTEEESISEYLTEVLKSDDPRYIARALRAIVDSRCGTTKLAKDIGMSPEALYRALGGSSNPGFGTIIKVIHALGVSLSASLPDRKKSATRVP